MALEKKCSRCGVTKPLTDFGVRPERNNSPPTSACRMCQSLKTQRWQRRNRDRRKDYMRLYREKNASAIATRMSVYQKKNKQALQTYNKTYYKQYYAKYKEEINAYGKQRTAQQRAWLRAFKEAPCADCGHAFSGVCMDFDHVRGSKVACVASLIDHRRSVIENELGKTELVCANCHRSRTLSRKGGPKPYRPTQLASMIDQLKSKPCVSCQKTYPTECMDFDHIDPDNKTRGIGSFRSATIRQLPELLAEVAKCRLLCACCHRLKTHSQTRSF